MTIATYSDLQTAIASWFFNRTDLPVTDLIRLTEQRINRDGHFRGEESDGSLVTVLSSRFVTLPTDFSEPRQLWLEWTWGREELNFVIPSKMDTRPNTGRPYYWTITGSQLAFERPADQVYSLTLRYLQQAQLSSTTTTNYVLTNYPDLYLFGALVEAATYVQDWDTRDRFEQRYQDTLASVNHQEMRSQALSHLVVDVALRKPAPFNIYSGEPY